jgi:hypothetical protein
MPLRIVSYCALYSSRLDSARFDYWIRLQPQPLARIDAVLPSGLYSTRDSIRTVSYRSFLVGTSPELRASQIEIPDEATNEHSLAENRLKGVRQCLELDM